MRLAIALAAAAGIALAVPSLAQDQKPAPQTPQAEHGMGGMMGMMSRMNRMMDRCEKMMSDTPRQPQQQKNG